LEYIARNNMGLDSLPFPLSALEHPPGNKSCSEITSFMVHCVRSTDNDNQALAEAEAIKLIQFLKENPPKYCYENPKLPDTKCTELEKYLINHIFYLGIDLPGSKHNPFGHLQYFSSFFIDMFFGNHTEFIDYINGLSKKELDQELNKREGYCKQSPIFAPIIGLRIMDLDKDENFTIEEKQKIKTLYNLNNENKHLQIMVKLIELGADVNAHDIHGYTPLLYAMQNANAPMVAVLLKHGANPNAESRDGRRSLSFLTIAIQPEPLIVINLLMQYGARLTDKTEINMIRNSVEFYGSKDLAVRVREAHPRDKEECEDCTKPAIKKCAACGLVYYCSPACQKSDWKFHMVTCKKNKKDN